MKYTPLHAAHVEAGAKMGEFAGYDMPLYYKLGVMKEHEWTRENAGIFDVSHMGQAVLSGAGAAKFLEKITPSAFQPKANGRAQYTVLTNEQGGIIDDLIVTRLAEDKFFLVINAGRKDVDVAWIRKNLPEGLEFDYWEDRALIAVQGPKAEQVIINMNEDVTDLPYMHLMESHGILISRLGYTGEDGFEISVPNDKAVQLWNNLMAQDEVEPIGLAARDSLRLEMGYCLYGHDINEETSPVEADIGWIISKKTSGYFGYDRIQDELKNGASKKRVGIKLTDKGVAREGAEIRNEADEKIGELTSGGFGPSVQGAIGQGYVPSEYAQAGTKLFVNVRGRNIAAEVANMPFIPAKTKSMKKKAAA